MALAEPVVQGGLGEKHIKMRGECFVSDGVVVVEWQVQRTGQNCDTQSQRLPHSGLVQTPLISTQFISSNLECHPVRFVTSLALIASSMKGR